MKKAFFIIITLIMSTINNFNQDEKETIILNEKDFKVIENEKNIIFQHDENFSFIFKKNKDLKNYVNLQEVKNDIIKFNQYIDKTKNKIKEVGISNFNASKFFNIKIYISNKKCNNEGALFSVHRLIVFDTEID